MNRARVAGKQWCPKRRRHMATIDLRVNPGRSTNHGLEGIDGCIR